MYAVSSLPPPPYEHRNASILYINNFFCLVFVFLHSVPCFAYSRHILKQYSVLSFVVVFVFLHFVFDLHTPGSFWNSIHHEISTRNNVRLAKTVGKLTSNFTAAFSERPYCLNAADCTHFPSLYLGANKCKCNSTASRAYVCFIQKNGFSSTHSTV